LVAAFLFAQLENLEKIQKKRIHLWNKYYELLRPLHEGKLLKLPSLPPFATNNGHLFYIVCRTGTERDRLIDWLRKAGVFSVFHYLSLHKSPYFKDKHDGRILANADKYTDCLFRLPLFYEMNDKQIGQMAKTILVFFKTK
jgi:dTDP-4-amino-4,6-dideoxygalactose transaminase